MSRMNAFERWFVSGPVQAAYLRAVCYPRVFGRVGPNLNGRVLEIGCGPGKTTAELRRRFPRVSLVAVDMDGELLERARRAVPGIEFRVEDATRFAFSDGVFDAVFEFNAFHHLDYRAALREAARVLKPRGSFYAADVCLRGHASKEGRFTRDGFIRAVGEAGLAVKAARGSRFITVHAVK